MTLPVIDLVRGWPTDLRELGRVLGALNRAIVTNGSRTYSADQRFSNQIAAANKQSTQSVNPLTATDEGGGLAEIQIAAHSVQYADRTVSYNAGSIAGLDNATLYYVVVDDPEFLGGAVSYLRSQNPNVVTQNLGRYFVGTITTPAGGAGGTTGGWGAGGGGGGNPLP